MSHSRQLLFCLLSLTVFCVGAQEISPYSQYAMGDMRAPGFTAQSSMGRITSGFRDPVHINFFNPASYSELKLTTFEGGIGMVNKRLQTDANTYKATNAFIDFLALAFPTSKGSAVTIGLMPYSSVSYEFEQMSSVGNIDYKRAFNGSGTVYQIFAGTGLRFPMKNDTATHSFSIGLNAIYLFGKTRYVEFVDFTDDATFFGTRKNTNLQNKGFASNTGIQYKLLLNKEWNLIVGADAYFPITAKTIYNDVWDRFRVTAQGVFIEDTVLATTDLKINRSLPVEYGGGAMIQYKSHWLFGADIHFKKWDAFSDILHPGFIFKNNVRYNVGTEIKPDFKGKSKLFKRMRYRFGAYYETAYLELNNKDISQYGITFGLGIPAKGTFSFMNLGVEIGQRGTIENNLLRETFFRTYIGFTLNDKWFIKRKYD